MCAIQQALLLFAYLSSVSCSVGLLCPSHSQNSANDAQLTLVSTPCKEGITLAELKLPKSFRSLHKETPPLQASASAQFCLPSEGLLEFLRAQSSWAVMVDTRMEAHAFVDSMPVMWYCPRNWELLDRDPHDILTIEHRRVQDLREQSEVLVSEQPKCKDDEGLDACERAKNLKVTALDPRKTQTEQEWAAEHGIRYYRLPIADHQRPDDNVVNGFIKMILREQTLSDGMAFFHVHCKGGKGRSTTLLLLLDMLFNSKHLSFGQLMARHKIHGITDLEDTTKEGQRWKAKYALERLNFLGQFYDYAKEQDVMNSSEFRMWSEWVSKGQPDLIRTMFSSRFELVERAVLWLKNAFGA